MAITVINPSVTKILLDLGIDPINPYDPDNAENTYMSAVREGINTIESATGGKGDRRTRILRQEFQGLLSRKKGKKIVDVSKLLVKKTLLPTSKIRPQALLPPSQEGEGSDKIGNVLNDILGVLRKDLALDKRESEDARKERERLKRIKSEETIENIMKGTGAVARAGQKVLDTITSPFKDIVSKIANFLKFTVIGVLFNKALNWFGEEKNREKIENLGRFFKDWWPTLLGGYLLFFTPLGGLVGMVTGIVTTALPTIVAALKSPAFLAALAAGTIVAGSIDAELRKKKIRQDFNETNDESITTVKEFQEQNKNIKEPGEKKSGMSFTQGILELGSTPGMQPFNQGGVVNNYFDKDGIIPGSGNEDTVPAVLTPGEFVMNKKAVKHYGTNIFERMNAVGGRGATGAKGATGATGARGQDGPLMMNDGGLVSNLPSTKPSSIKEETQTTFSSIKSKGIVPVSIPVKIKTESKTIVLPEITRPKPAVRIREGSTVPVFDIMVQSSSRRATLVSLGIEDMLS